MDARKRNPLKLAYMSRILLNIQQAMLKGVGNIGKKLHASQTERRTGTGK